MVVSWARPCGWEMVWLDKLKKWILDYLQKLGRTNWLWCGHQPVVVMNFIHFLHVDKGVQPLGPPLLKVFMSVKNWIYFRHQTFHHRCYIAKLQLFGNHFAHSCGKNSQLLPWVFVLKEYQDFHHARTLQAARVLISPIPINPVLNQGELSTSPTWSRHRGAPTKTS